MAPPFEWLAVFAHKHALAHASEGLWEKWPTGQPQAGGSEYLDLHGAFPSPCALQEQRSSARCGFLAGRGAPEIGFQFVLYLRAVLGRNEAVTKPAGRTTARITSYKPTSHY